jgi:hypothetical protein
MKVNNQFYDFLNDDDTFFQKEKQGLLRKDSIYRKKDAMTSALKEGFL